MNEELVGKLKYLRLGGLLAHWDEYLKLAAQRRLSHNRLLTHILEEEYRNEGKGKKVEEKKVDYEFQKGGNKLLCIQS